MSMALGTWLSRRWAIALPVVALTGWQLLIGGIVLAPMAFLVDPPLHQVTLTQAAGYLWLCVAGAMLAYGLWFRGIGRLPGGCVGDEPAESGDGGAVRLDLPWTKN
jgi:probable blue pigment (indigoidine) exporter